LQAEPPPVQGGRESCLLDRIGLQLPGSNPRSKGRVAVAADLLRIAVLRLVAGMSASLKMEAHAARGAFPMLALAVATEVHLYIDSADEVAPDLNVVKGRACSLLREKVIEAGRRRPLRLHRRRV
jgi:hypothetical protein